jgi:hypothetical protein
MRRSLITHVDAGEVLYTLAQTVKDPVADTRWQRGLRFLLARQVKPLLERSCVACHGGEKPRGLFRIDDRDAILKGGESGAAAVVPGHSEKSLLVDYVSCKAPGSDVPPSAVREKYPGLTTDEVAILCAWIDQGAEWPTGVLLAAPMLEKHR